MATTSTPCNNSNIIRNLEIPHKILGTTMEIFRTLNFNNIRPPANHNKTTLITMISSSTLIFNLNTRISLNTLRIKQMNLKNKMRSKYPIRIPKIRFNKLKFKIKAKDQRT